MSLSLVETSRLKSKLFISAINQVIEYGKKG